MGKIIFDLGQFFSSDCFAGKGTRWTVLEFSACLRVSVRSHISLIKVFLPTPLYYPSGFQWAWWMKPSLWRAQKLMEGGSGTAVCEMPGLECIGGMKLVWGMAWTAVPDHVILSLSSPSMEIWDKWAHWWTYLGAFTFLWAPVAAAISGIIPLK